MEGSGEGWVRKRTAVSFANAGVWGAQPSLMCLTAGSDRRSLNMLKKGKVHSFSFPQLSQLEALITVERTALKESGVSSRRPLFSYRSFPFFCVVFFSESFNLDHLHPYGTFPGQAKSTPVKKLRAERRSWCEGV